MEVNNRFKLPENIFRYALMLALSVGAGSLGCNKQIPTPARPSNGECGENEGSFTMNEHIARCHLFRTRDEVIETVEGNGKHEKYCAGNEARYILCERIDEELGTPVWPESCEEPLGLLSHRTTCSDLEERRANLDQ